MKFEAIERGNSVIIKMKDDLKFASIEAQFQQLIQKNLNENNKIFVVDLSEVKYVNSNGIGLLIRGYTSVVNAGGSLVLANINEKLKELLSITKLITIFNIYSSVDEALKSLNA